MRGIAWGLCALAGWLVLAASSGAKAQTSRLDPTGAQVASGDTHPCALTTSGNAACKVKAALGPMGTGACGAANGVATLTEPSMNLCAAGTASSVATNATHFTWVCAGTGGSGSCQLAVVCTGTGDTRSCQPTWICTDPNGGNAACSAPRQYEVTASAGPNGSLDCASPVTAGSTTTCTATPNTGYRTQSISGCGGTPSGPTVNGYATGAITGACMVTASFVANPLGNTSQGGAPFTGTTVPPQGGTSGPASASFTSADGGINCAFDPAGTGFVAATAGYPVQGATLPHGMFRFKLAGCQPGFTARVTVNWPSLSGLQVLKYGKASAGAAASFFVPRSLVIRGNSVSFDVTDGQLGDDDGVVNGEIVDPVAAVREPPREVPVLGLPGLALLGALLMGFGMVGRFGARQRNGRRG